MGITKMHTLWNSIKGDSNPGSLDWESGILPLSYHAPLNWWMNLDGRNIVAFWQTSWTTRSSYLVRISATTRHIWLAMVLPSVPWVGRGWPRAELAPSLCGSSRDWTDITIVSITDEWWRGRGCDKNMAKHPHLRTLTWKKAKGTFYIAQYLVRWTAQRALHGFLPWQTCSFQHKLGFSGKHSSNAAIIRED